MKITNLVLFCLILISCGDSSHGDGLNVNIPNNSVYLVFENEDTLKFTEMRPYIESNLGGELNGVIEASLDTFFSDILFLQWEVTSSEHSSILSATYTLGDTADLFGINGVYIDENTESQVKGISKGIDFLNVSTFDVKKADVVFNVKKVAF